MTEVILYGREGCCLCDDARAMLDRITARSDIVVSEVDIERDDELMRRYLERIPVIVIDGQEAFELVVDEAELSRHLANQPSAAARREVE